MDLLTYLQLHPVVFLLASGALGLVMGSFLNVVIYRLPKRMEHDWRRECCDLLELPAPDTGPPPGLVWPRSACPHCQHAIPARHNIPVLSFLLLRGRCAFCDGKIALRYPAVELLSGILTVVVAWRFGVGASALAAMILTWALIALSVIDLDTQLLPDDITLPLLWLGLGINFFHVFTSLHSSVAGAIAGYLSLWLVYKLFKWATGKEGMGYGDFKLLAVLGAWMGWQYLPIIILLSSLCGALAGLGMVLARRMGRSTPMPFGPWLAAAGWVTLLWGHGLMRAWLGAL